MLRSGRLSPSESPPFRCPGRKKEDTRTRRSRFAPHGPERLPRSRGPESGERDGKGVFSLDKGRKNEYNTVNIPRGLRGKDSRHEKSVSHRSVGQHSSVGPVRRRFRGGLRLSRGSGRRHREHARRGVRVHGRFKRIRRRRSGKSVGQRHRHQVLHQRDAHPLRCDAGRSVYDRRRDPGDRQRQRGISRPLSLRLDNPGFLGRGELDHHQKRGRHLLRGSQLYLLPRLHRPDCSLFVYPLRRGRRSLRGLPAVGGRFDRHEVRRRFRVCPGGRTERLPCVGRSAG